MEASDSMMAQGIDFVRCRICGKHLRVISGAHLRIHGIDREAYMLEYRLSPDELCAIESRQLHSKRRDYHPYGKRDWIAAIKKLHRSGSQVFAGHLQRKNPHLYHQGVWLFGSWNKALAAAGFTPDKMRLWAFWDQEKLIKQIQSQQKEPAALSAARNETLPQAVFGGSTPIRILE